MDILSGILTLSAAILAISVWEGIVESRRPRRTAGERRGGRPLWILPRLLAFGALVTVAAAWASGADDAPGVVADEMRRHALLLGVDSLSDDRQPARAEIHPDALLRYVTVHGG